MLMDSREDLKKGNGKGTAAELLNGKRKKHAKKKPKPAPKLPLKREGSEKQKNDSTTPQVNGSTTGPKGTSSAMFNVWVF